MLAYCEHVVGDGHAALAAAEAFRRFRAAVVEAPDLGALDPEAVLISATRSAAAEHVPQPPQTPDVLRGVARRPATGWCGDVPALLAARANCTISRIDLARLEQHLSGCPACRAPEARFKAAERAYRNPPDTPMPLPATAAIIAALATAAPLRAAAVPQAPSRNGPAAVVQLEPPATPAPPAPGPELPPLPVAASPPELPPTPAAELPPQTPVATTPPAPPPPAPPPPAPEPPPPAPPVAAPPPAPAPPAEPRPPPPEPEPEPEAPITIAVPEPEPDELYAYAPEPPQPQPVPAIAPIEPHDSGQTMEYRVADFVDAGDDVVQPVGGERPPRRTVLESLSSVSLPSVSLPSISLPGRRSRASDSARERVSPMPPPQRAAGATARASSGSRGADRTRPAALLPAGLVVLAILIAMAFAGVFGGGGDPASPTSVSPTPTAPDDGGKAPDVIVVPGGDANAAAVEAAKARARARAKRDAARQDGSATPATPQSSAPAGSGSPPPASAQQRDSTPPPPPPPPPASPQVNGGAGATGNQGPSDDTSAVPGLAPAP